MRLCVPLSDAFREQQENLLLLVSAISFKKPSAEQFPGKVHCLESSYNISSRDFAEDLRESGILEALRSGKYKSFACDIGPICKTRRGVSPNGFPRAFPVSPGVAKDEYIERAAKNADWLRGEFSGHIQVENLNYFPTGGYEVVCEAGFICDLVDAAKVGLLLDIPHAVISATNLGYKDPVTYIRELPLHAVGEIHVSRAGILNGVLEDLHEAPGETEVSIAKKIIADGHQVEYLTVEYYRDGRILSDIYRSMARDLNIKPGTPLSNVAVPGRTYKGGAR